MNIDEVYYDFRKAYADVIVAAWIENDVRIVAMTTLDGRGMGIEFFDTFDAIPVTWLFMAGTFATVKRRDVIASHEEDDDGNACRDQGC